MKSKIYSLITTITLLYCYCINAHSLYDCIMPYNENLSVTNAIVRPASPHCHDSCKNSCSQALRSVNVDPEAVSESILVECITRCKAGRTSFDISGFKHFLHIEDEVLNILDLDHDCIAGSASVRGISYPTMTDTIVQNGDVVYLHITPAEGINNIIYRDGVKNLEIVPRISSLDPAAWNGVQLSDSEWHIRRNSTYDTQLNINAGDHLTITFGGLMKTYRRRELLYNEVTDCPQNEDDLTNGVECVFNAPLALILNDRRSGSLHTFRTSHLDILNGVTSWGLEPVSLWTEKKYDDLDEIDKNAPFSTFQGNPILGNTERSSIHIAPYSGNENNSNNLGGYNVYITLKRSPLATGQGLQYAIIPLSEEPNDQTDWIDIPAAQITNGAKFTINVTSEDVTSNNAASVEDEVNNASNSILLNNSRSIAQSRIYLRIDPTLFTSVADASGAYNVRVIKNSTSRSIIKDFINYIKIYLHGEPNNDRGGALKYIFSELIASSFFIILIRYIIVLSIAWTSLMFLIGSSRYNTKELLLIIAKLSTVHILLSPNSWNFFSLFFFDIISSCS